MQCTGPTAGAAPSLVRDGVEWFVSNAPVPYAAAMAVMEERAAALAEGAARECVWLLEHPALYTAGTSARASDLLDPGRLEVVSVGRGGQYTYHGPGQRIAYVIVDLRHRGRDVRAFVHALEAWIIDVLGALGVRAERRSGRVGVWVTREAGRDDKIAAIGVRVRRWVTTHGIALNVDPDLAHYAGIVPCGVSGHGVTSLAALGRPATPGEVDALLMERFASFVPRHAGVGPAVLTG